MSIPPILAGRWIRFWPWPFGSLRKVDEVDLQENEGVVELVKETDEEARRLLYVGLTRARDLLIQVLPEKTQDGGLLGSLGPGAATLLKPAIPGRICLTLPSDVSVPYACQILKPEAQAVPSRTARHHHPFRGSNGNSPGRCRFMEGGRLLQQPDPHQRR